jgi:hypothetical protein
MKLEDDTAMAQRITWLFNQKLNATTNLHSKVDIRYVAEAVRYAIIQVAFHEAKRLPGSVTPVSAPKKSMLTTVTRTAPVKRVQPVIAQTVIIPSPHKSKLVAKAETAKQKMTETIELVTAGNINKKGPLVAKAKIAKQTMVTDIATGVSKFSQYPQSKNSIGSPVVVKAKLSSQVQTPITSPPIHRLMISPSHGTKRKTHQSPHQVRDYSRTDTVTAAPNTATTVDRSDNSNPQTPSSIEAFNKNDYLTSSGRTSFVTPKQRNLIPFSTARTEKWSSMIDSRSFNNRDATNNRIDSNYDGDDENMHQNNMVAASKRNVTDQGEIEYCDDGDNEEVEDKEFPSKRQKVSYATTAATTGISPFHREILKLNLAMIMDE